MCVDPNDRLITRGLLDQVGKKTDLLPSHLGALPNSYLLAELPILVDVGNDVRGSLEAFVGTEVVVAQLCQDD